MAILHKVGDRNLLELTADEAKTIFIITQYMGGSTYDSRRVHTDSIGNALKAGGLFLRPEAYRGILSCDDGLAFESEPSLFPGARGPWAIMDELAPILEYPLGPPRRSSPTGRLIPQYIPMDAPVVRDWGMFRDAPNGDER